MTRTVLPGLKSRAIRSVVLASATLALLCAATPAQAQIFRASGAVPTLEPGGIMRGTDTAYDPVNGVYLVVVGNGPVYGVFVNAAGTPVTAPFAIFANDASTWAHFPRVEYSAHAPNGVGGSGGFLVTWNSNSGNTNFVWGRIVAYTSGVARVVTDTQLISDGDQLGTWHETGPAMAYSASSGKFLVAWRTNQYAIQGRFVTAGGVPTGPVMLFENPGGSRDPALTWNPATNEFGLVSTGFGGSGAFAAFRRINVAGGVSARTTFGFGPGTFATAIDVNSSNQYVLVWAVHPGTMSATFDQNGTLLTSNFITDRLGFDQSLGLAYNSATGTFLAVSSDRDTAEVGAVEIAFSGLPNSSAQLVTDGGNPNGGGSFHPLTASRPGTNQWNVVYSRNFRGAVNQFVGTTSTGGGTGAVPPPPPPPSGGGSSSGCSTPDPFASIGGGRCVNGGWVPGGGSATPPPPPPAPAPPPPPPPSGGAGCATADPFASIGGGRCVNGGWIPGGGGGNAAPPPAPPVGSGCSTPNPFASLGGGACVNGNWILNSSGGCSGSDPFASIGGGSCLNGGWIPGGGGGSASAPPPPAPPATAAGCSGSDPFATAGGGACVNGGWVPVSIACTGPDPFVSIGGGVCINRGWVPR
jgi:hypothetical protein